MRTPALAGLLALVPAVAIAADDQPRTPNIVLILADDLGYGDLGCYGQAKIRTPNLDRLAAQGMRFTQCYAGSTVCAPSRCTLMTGMHTGHARIRGNKNVPLRPEDVTVAEVLKGAGYATGLVGKWGLGNEGTTGIPTKQGFDTFLGFLDQVHAHNSYPDFLWSGEERLLLPANVQAERGVAARSQTYAPDVFAREACRFIEAHRDHPFFLDFATTIPHANNERARVEGNGMEVPSDAEYFDEPWPQAQKNHAAMITRLDEQVGRVLATLDRLDLSDDTVVLFTSDNGPLGEGGADAAFFDSNGPLRGIKRDLTEGGIRVPGIVRWPSHIPAGVDSDQVWAFWDLLPTAAALAGAEPPAGIDGVSILPALAEGTPVDHPPLYWEFHERGFEQAARLGDWKGIRHGPEAPLELYDLSNDIGEAHDIAADHPEVVERITAFLDGARTPSEDFPIRQEAR